MTTFCSCFVEGFKQMTSAIMILSLAWTLSGVVGEDYLNIGSYVGSVVSDNATIAVMLPAVFFLVAIGLAFATGTSWGTFGILIPIVLAIVANDNNLMVMTVAAVLAGAVGGDHVSRFPIPRFWHRPARSAIISIMSPRRFLMWQL